MGLTNDQNNRCQDDASSLLLGPAAAALSGIDGKSPFSSSASPLMSLLGDSSASDENGGLSTTLNAMGAFGNIDGDSANQASGGLDSFAKSLLTNLAKRMDQKDTQKTVCKFINSASKQQITQVASMAGLSLSDAHASRIENFCTGVTPLKLSKGVSFTKKAIWTVNLMRKVMKVVAKYRHLLVYFFMLAWIKSAILRPPLPIKNK